MTDGTDGHGQTDGTGRTDMDSTKGSESDRTGKVLRFEQARFGIGTRDGRTWTNGTDGRDGTDGHGQTGRTDRTDGRNAHRPVEDYLLRTIEGQVLEQSGVKSTNIRG